EGIYLHRLVYNDQGKAKNYRIIDANDISEKHLEIKKIDAIGKLATELFKTEEAPFLEEYSKVAETGESYSFEQYFDPMDKHFSISVFSPKKGDFATLFIDITEKKRIETALKESEERQRLIIKGLNDAPWDWDLIKDELFYSPQWCQQLGYKPNEIPPNSSLWERLMHPDDKPEVDKIFNGALTKGQESYEVEFRLKHKKGHYVPVLSRGFITFDENKKPIRVSGTNLDLSERKKIELELIKAKEIAEKSEKYLENILENIADPIFVKDEESKLLQVNEAFCKLFGLNKENIIGKDLAEDVSPSERESFLRIDKMVLNSGEENINEESLTVHGGQTKIISTKKSRFLDEKGGKFLIGIIRDITGGKQKEIELLNAKVKAEENEAKYRELFNNVGDAIFIYDPDTYEIFEANKATSDIYGYSHEELIGMSCLKFSAKVEKFKSGAKSIKNQEKININFRHHKKKDGTDLFVELTTYNISVNGKNIVYSVCHDISDIKKTEAELIKHQNNLEELVSQRTIELELINRDLENFNKLFVGREFRIKELRDQVNELKSQIRKLQS
ncbi:MAG: PAS domain S-box protein, partial [Bacteroidales bacterium]|nr:PAS domain S-box protein [Bacteroidales bacterium]